jgi:hypothetical protein
LVISRDELGKAMDRIRKAWRETKNKMRYERNVRKDF